MISAREIVRTFLDNRKNNVSWTDEDTKRMSRLLGIYTSPVPGLDLIPVVMDCTTGTCIRYFERSAFEVMKPYIDPQYLPQQ